MMARPCQAAVIQSIRWKSAALTIVRGNGRPSISVPSTANAVKLSAPSSRVKVSTILAWKLHNGTSVGPSWVGFKWTICPAEMRYGPAAVGGGLARRSSRRSGASTARNSTGPTRSKTKVARAPSDLPSPFSSDGWHRLRKRFTSRFAAGANVLRNGCAKSNS